MNFSLLFFTEILVGGFGGTLWLFLFITAATHKEAYNTLTSYLGSSSHSVILLLFLLILSYVMGIIIDRFLFFISSKTTLRLGSREEEALFLKKYKEKLLTEYECWDNGKATKINSIKLEKFLRNSSDSFNKRIDYNKNRLIVTQAWALNSLLITFGLMLNYGNFELLTKYFWPVIIASFIFFIIMFITAFVITRDYNTDLRCSFNLIIKQEEKKEKRDLTPREYIAKATARYLRDLLKYFS